MGNKFRDINIKIKTHSILDDITNMKNFDSNIKIDEKSYNNVYLSYWICDDQRFQIHKNECVNPLYLIIIKVNE